jgi:hypothetical protein
MEMTKGNRAGRLAFVGVARRRRLRAKGSVFAFAPTVCGADYHWWFQLPRTSEKNRWTQLGNRQWKPIFTGSSIKATPSENGLFSLAVVVTEPPVEIILTMVVLLHQPPVLIARFHRRLR